MALHRIDTGKMVLHVSDEGLKLFDAAMKDQVKEWSKESKEEWSLTIENRESGSNNNENLPDPPNYLTDNF